MSRFTFNFYLDIRKPLKSGLFSIKVNLYDGKEKRGINFTIKKVEGLEISASKRDWQDIWPNKDKINSFGDVIGETTVYGHKLAIRTILKAKQDILNEIVAFEGNQSLGAIKDAFYNYKQPASFVDDVYKAFESQIKYKEKQERYKTRDTYRTTLNNIRRHTQDRALRFTDITKLWLEDFELARKKLGKSTSSISVDMRNIRTIYNQVKDGNAYLIESYPFGQGKNKYTIKKGKGKNQGLRQEDIEKIVAYSTSNTYRQRARDVFLFSYYSGGMNYKDIILLTYKDAENGYFIRKKTEFTVNEETKIPLRLRKEQKEIISRYKGKGKYLFNFLPNNANEKDIYEEQTRGIMRLDKHIKAFAKELGLGVKLSFQWARHSYATNLLLAGIPKKAISESLGHKSLTTAENYFDSLFDEKSEDIAKVLGLSND